MRDGRRAGDDPLVSCVMPTANRRPFIGQAMRYFLRQDHPAKELIVVDDGDDPVGDLLPLDARVKYVRLKRRHTLGTKLNVGCDVARGDLIARWDDVDWQAPGRLSRQVEQLCGSG